jgi:hypothetical protein
MGGDLASLVESDQPMAQIFFQSFGQKPTLAIWSIVVIVQCVSESHLLIYSLTCAFHRYMMGSSMVCAH